MEKLAEAEFKLGEVYFFRRKEFKEAEKWYLRAVDNGHCVSAYRLVMLYVNDLVHVTNKHEKVEQFYLKATEKEIIEAQYKQGYLFFSNKNYGEAVKWWSKCYEKDKRGCYGLGVLYEIHHKDKEKALEYYKKGAERGHTESQHRCGSLHLANREYEEASKWYRQAAQNNEHARAAYFLGRMYQKGQVHSSDKYKKAKEFYLIAADKGDDNTRQAAQFGIGKICVERKNHVGRTMMRLRNGD